MTKVREDLRKYEEKLQEVINQVSQSYKHNGQNYSDISEVLQFIKENTENLTPALLKEITFLVGATGAGKSTLVNYLNSNDDNFVVASKQQDIKPIISIAEIGNGKGSTTLFPNLISSEFGNFLDFAGEGDTGGATAEIINSIVKTKIASNTEKAKVLFVTQQSALGAGGGYGANFKQALDKNSQFFSDINRVKNSVGFVVTKADFYDDGLLEELLGSISGLLNHSDLGSYRNTIEQVLENKNIASFSRPPDGLKPGDEYYSPEWNPNQRENIIDMINKIPFAVIPTKDYFNTSSSPEVREVMQKTMKVVQSEAGNLINKAVTQSSPFEIFSVEIKPFSKYLGGLASDYVTDLVTYAKVLSYNNYLKKDKIDLQKAEKINDELVFLRKFTDKSFTESKYKEDWGKIADVKKVFKAAYDDAQKIALASGNNFSKFKTEGSVTTKSSSASGELVKQNFDKLYQQYMELEVVEALGKQQGSKYYKDVTKKVFSHRVTNIVEETRYVSVEAQEPDGGYRTEPITEERTKWVDKHRYDQELEDHGSFVTKYKTETYTVEEVAPGRTAAVHLLTFGLGTFGKALFGGGVAYTDTVTKTRQVEDGQMWQSNWVSVPKRVDYQEQEIYDHVIKQSEWIQKYKTITKQVPQKIEVDKSYDEYKNEVVKELDRAKYNADVQSYNDEITKLRKVIEKNIVGYPKGNPGVYIKEAIYFKDKTEEKFKDLMTDWQNAEYVAYFAINPNNSLGEVGVQMIGDSFKVIINDCIKCLYNCRNSVKRM